MYGYITGDTSQPLYEGSKICATTSWCSILQYALSNHLTYKAIEELLDLMQVYCH